MSAPQQAAGTAQEQAGAVAGTAREQASAVGSTATSAAGDVAGTAKEQAGHVVGEAVDQAKNLTGQVREQVGQQVGAQTQKATGALRDISRQLSEGDTSGVVGTVLTEVGQRVQDLADALEAKGPQGMVEDLRSYARRNPGSFLLGATLAGLVTGRLVKGLSAGSGTSGASYGGPGTSYGGTGTPSYGGAIGTGGTATVGTGTAGGDPLAGLVPAGGSASGTGFPPPADLTATGGTATTTSGSVPPVTGTQPLTEGSYGSGAAATPYPGSDEPVDPLTERTAPYGTRGAL